jgi:MFS family permease
VSELGTQVSALAIPLLAVTVLKATAFQVSVLTALSSVPFLLISLPAGVMVDHLRKRRLMIWCNVGRFAVMASIPLAAVTWGVSLPQLYLTTLLIGVCTVVFDISYQSYLPTLLEHEQLVDGNGKLATTESLARFAGPSLGGALIALVGAARTVIIDVLSYAVSLISLLLIRTQEPDPAEVPHATRTPLRAAMAEGLRFVLGDPVLRSIVACSASANIFLTAIAAIRVIYLTEILHVSSAVVGAVFALGAVGGVLGGLLAGRLARRVGSARIIWVAMLAPGPLYVLMPLAQPGWGVLLFAVGWTAYSASVIVYNTAQVSYRQAICPPTLLGRVNAATRWIVWGAMPFGALFGGTIAQCLGLRPALWTCVIGLWASSLWVLCSPLLRMRETTRPVEKEV